MKNLELIRLLNCLLDAKSENIESVEKSGQILTIELSNTTVKIKLVQNFDFIPFSVTEAKNIESLAFHLLEYCTNNAKSFTIQ